MSHLLVHPQERESLKTPTDGRDDAEHARHDATVGPPADTIDDTRRTRRRDTDEHVRAVTQVEEAKEEKELRQGGCVSGNILDS